MEDGKKNGIYTIEKNLNFPTFSVCEEEKEERHRLATDAAQSLMTTVSFSLSVHMGVHAHTCGKQQFLHLLYSFPNPVFPFSPFLPVQVLLEMII